MSRLGWLAAILAASALACSGDNSPKDTPNQATSSKEISDRFEPGSDAMITAEAGSPGILMDTKGAKGTFGPDMASLDLGTKVRIIDDVAADDPDDLDGRKVRVQVREGEHEGLPGLVRRKNLVPIK